MEKSKRVRAGHLYMQTKIDLLEYKKPFYKRDQLSNRRESRLQEAARLDATPKPQLSQTIAGKTATFSDHNSAYHLLF